MKGILLLLATVASMTLLAGCAMQLYVPPAADDPAVARIRIVSGLIPTTVDRLEEPCIPLVSDQRSIEGTKRIAVFTMFKDESRTVLGMPMSSTAKYEDFHETRVRANEKINLLLSYVPFPTYTGRWCSIGIQFIPELGKDYQLDFDYVSFDQCGLTLQEISSSDGITGSFGAVPTKVLDRCLDYQAPRNTAGAIPGI